MRILVFGATGGTGREIVKQGLDRGHRVTAFARTPEKVTLRHHNLSVAKGDILDWGSLEAAIMDQEVVLSALGVNAFRQNSVLSDGTRNIIRVMKEFEIHRFIVETAAGVGKSKQQLHRILRWLMLALILRNVYIDKELQEKYIKESGLEWVIVRPAALTDGPLTGEYQVKQPEEPAPFWAKISRADVADFMLNQLTSDTYLYRTPSLMY